MTARVYCTDSQHMTAAMIIALRELGAKVLSDSYTVKCERAYDFDMPTFPFAEEKIMAITYGPPKKGKRGKVRKW